MGRLRSWLLGLLTRSNGKPNEDPLPRPTPGEIMAIRVLIPTEGDRAPSEKQAITFFRLGYRRACAERPTPLFVPVPLTPVSGAPIDWRANAPLGGTGGGLPPSAQRTLDQPDLRERRDGSYFIAEHHRFMPEAPTVGNMPAIRRSFRTRRLEPLAPPPLQDEGANGSPPLTEGCTIEFWRDTFLLGGESTGKRAAL